MQVFWLLRQFGPFVGGVLPASFAGVLLDASGFGELEGGGSSSPALSSLVDCVSAGVGVPVGPFDLPPLLDDLLPLPQPSSPSSQVGKGSLAHCPSLQAKSAVIATPEATKIHPDVRTCILHGLGCTFDARSREDAPRTKPQHFSPALETSVSWVGRERRSPDPDRRKIRLRVVVMIEVVRVRRERVFLLLAFLNGCRCEDRAPTNAPAINDASSDAPGSHDGEITHALPPACEGKSLSLIQSVTDERCAIRHDEWASLGTPSSTIRPKAELAGAGDAAAASIRFSLTNTSKTAAIDLPLRFQADKAQLSVVAEDKDHILYELASPTLLDLPSDAGVTEGITDPMKLRAIRQESILRDRDAEANKSRVYSARVRLAPQGSVSARYLVNTTIERRIAPSCDACAAPSKLGAGRYTLHLGQMFVDLGPELASVAIDVP